MSNKKTSSSFDDLTVFSSIILSTSRMLKSTPIIHSLPPGYQADFYVEIKFRMFYLMAVVSIH